MEQDTKGPRIPRAFLHPVQRNRLEQSTRPAKTEAMTASVNTTLLDGRVILDQPEEGFRAGMDTVFAAAFAPVKPGARVLDAGCGVGSIALCLLARVPGLSVTGIELQPHYADLAVRNAAHNGVQDRLRILCADIRDFAPEKDDQFDHVVCNPPYMPHGAHQRAQSPAKASAMGQGEGEAALEDWLDRAFRALKSGGTLTLVQRAEFLDRLLQMLGGRFGAFEILPLHSKPGQTAKRVLLRAVKDRKSPLTLYPGLILHHADGTYTDAAEAVLRHMAVLPLPEPKDP